MQTMEAEHIKYLLNGDYSRVWVGTIDLQLPSDEAWSAKTGEI